MISELIKRSKLALQMLPNSLLVALALFALLPLWSLSFLSINDIVHLRPGGTAASLQALTYWLLPVCVCAAILARSFWVLPFFLADCGGLVALVLTGPQTNSLVVTKLAFLAVAVVTCLVVVQKDLLFPFMARGARFWRRTPRLFVNHQIVLQFAGKEERRCMLEDCSLTGMAVALPNERATGLDKGSRVEVKVTGRGTTVVVPVQLVWVRDVGDMIRLGLEAIDTERMQTAFLTVSDRGGATSGFGRSLDRLWAKSAVRRTALALFGVSVGVSFGMPACGVMPPAVDAANHRTAAMRASSATESTAAVSGQQLGNDWRQVAAAGQDGDTVRFALDQNDETGVTIDAGAAVAGAVLMVPKGGIKQPVTLKIRPGVNLNTADFWTWVAVKQQAPVKTMYAALEFSPDQVTKEPITLTLRLPLTTASVDPKALVVLYRVVRSGHVVYGVLGSEHLRILPSGAALGLTDSPAARVVEFQLSSSFSGSVQLGELTTPGQGDAERAVGSGDTALETPRHIALVCALPAATLCDAAAVMLRQSGQTIAVTAISQLPALAAGDLSTAINEQNLSDILILGQGSLVEGTCFVGSGDTCVDFGNLRDTLKDATSARLWLLNCPAPSTPPAGIAAAECLAAGDDPASASRLLQLLSDPLIGVFAGSSGTLGQEGLGRYLDQSGTNATTSFTADPALASSGPLPAVTPTSSTPLAQNGGTTGSQNNSTGAGSDGGSGPGGSTGSNTGSSGGSVGGSTAGTSSGSTGGSSTGAVTFGSGGSTDGGSASSGGGATSGSATGGSTTAGGSDSGAADAPGSGAGFDTTSDARELEFPVPSDDVQEVVDKLAVAASCKAPSMLKMSVVGCSAKPVAGVKIEVRQDGKLIDSCTTSDASGATPLGQCSLVRGTGNYAFTITPPPGSGFLPYTGSIPADNNGSFLLKADQDHVCVASQCNNAVPKTLKATNPLGDITFTAADGGPWKGSLAVGGAVDNKGKPSGAMTAAYTLDMGLTSITVNWRGICLPNGFHLSPNGQSIQQEFLYSYASDTNKSAAFWVDDLYIRGAVKEVSCDAMSFTFDIPVGAFGASYCEVDLPSSPGREVPGGAGLLTVTK